MSQFQKRIRRTQEVERLVGVAVSDVCVHGSCVERTNQRMKAALCFLS